MPGNRWTPELLASLRNEMDPVADKAVAAFYGSGQVGEVNQLLAAVMSGTRLPASELPPALRDYVAASAKLPDWHDPAQIRVAEEVFGDWGVSSCAILACASLPECYLMRNGIHVLAMTQRLQQHAQRRVLETAQMIMAVMFPGGISENGMGVRTAQRVRLMHAAMRYLILHSTPPAQAPSTLGGVMQQATWKPEYGQPINQQDLLYTLMTFSHIGVRSLDRLGVELSDIQKDAYIHCWSVIGYIMGIREDVLPANHVEAETLFETIKASQGGGTPEATAMQASLLAFIEGLLPPGPLRRLPVYLTRHLINDDTADILGVPRIPWRDRFLQATIITFWQFVDKELSGVLKKKPHLQFASAWFHDLLMAEIGKLPEAWNRELFGMPSTLQANLPPDWQHSALKAPSMLTTGLLRRL